MTLACVLWEQENNHQLEQKWGHEEASLRLAELLRKAAGAWEIDKSLHSCGSVGKCVRSRDNPSYLDRRGQWLMLIFHPGCMNKCLA